MRGLLTTVAILTSLYRSILMLRVDVRPSVVDLEHIYISIYVFLNRARAVRAVFSKFHVRKWPLNVNIYKYRSPCVAGDKTVNSVLYPW